MNIFKTFLAVYSNMLLGVIMSLSAAAIIDFNTDVFFKAIIVWYVFGFFICCIYEFHRYNHDEDFNDYISDVDLHQTVIGLAMTGAILWKYLFWPINYEDLFKDIKINAKTNKKEK